VKGEEENNKEKTRFFETVTNFREKSEAEKPKGFRENSSKSLILLTS
jgi:hypothetical protein